MNVTELLAALDVGFAEVRAIAETVGVSTWDLPSEVNDARAHVATAAERRFGDRALYEIVEKSLPAQTIRRLLRQPWNGRRADYNLRPDGHPDVSDTKVRQLAAQLAAAWNSPDVVDERMSCGLAGELFRPVEQVDDAREAKRLEADEAPAPEMHAPSWWTDTYFRVSPDANPPEGLSRMDRPLFEHQQDSVRSLTKWWSHPSKRAGVLCLPTGGGKTRTAVNFVLSEATKKGKILWLTHREELMNQAIGTFLESAGDAEGSFTMGRFAAGHLKVQAPVDVLVASIPTLAIKRSKRLHYLDQVLRQQGDFALIVVDECHHGTARTWKRLIEELQVRCPNIKLLGLSATPTRNAKEEHPAFWKLFDGIVHEVQLVDLIHRRVLAKPKVETIDTGVEFSANLNEKAAFAHFNDLPVSLVNRICADEGRNNKVVSAFVEGQAEWGSTLIFAATVEQGRYITRKLREAGVAADEVYGDSRAAQRKQVVQAFRDGRIQAVVNCGLFTEGTDLPGVQTVFLARPTRSKILFRQMVGRGLRGPKIGGSEECTVVAFFDEVSGLVKESLASCFRDEHEAAMALGIGAVAASDPPGADESEQEVDDVPPEDDDGIKGLEDELRALVRENVTTDGGSVTSSLLGWWEAVRGGRRAFLPVFDDVAEAINGFVSVLPENVDTFAASEDLLLPESVLRRFLSIARRPGVEPRYVDLDEATSEEVRAVLEEVGAAKKSESDPAELDWMQSKSDEAGDERFAVLVDGQFEEVQAKNLWRLRKEWDHYAVEFGIEDQPDFAPALAELLVAKAAKAGLDETDVLAILDSAADHKEFPSARRTTPKADVPGLLKALGQTEESKWGTVVEKAWANGLSEAFESKSDLLLAAMVQVAKAA